MISPHCTLERRNRGNAPDQPLVRVALLYGGRAGDELRLRITAPDGTKVLAQAEPLDRA